MKELFGLLLIFVGIRSIIGCTPVIVEPNNTARVEIEITNDSPDPIRVNGVWFDDRYDTAWTTVRPDSVYCEVWGKRYHFHILVDGQPQIGGGWHQGALKYTIYLPRK